MSSTLSITTGDLNNYKTLQLYFKDLYDKIKNISKDLWINMTENLNLGSLDSPSILLK